jgi:hypothetical protein
MGKLINKFLIRIVLYFIVLSMIILIIGCNETEIKSKPLERSKEITVDGNLNEWDKNIFSSIDDKLKIAACNDNKFYYLCGEVLDKSIGKTFALSGITLLINPEGDKKNNIEMNFKYPGRKQINYEKGGFFRMLMGNQKIKVLRNMEKLNDAVFLFDTTELKSYAFTESEDADFQGEMRITDNKLLFELKIPFQFNKYYKSYPPLSDKSFFCLKPGSLRGQMFSFPSMMNNYSEGKKDNQRGRPGGFDKVESPQSLQYWFSIKTNNYE